MTTATPRVSYDLPTWLDLLAPLVSEKQWQQEVLSLAKLGGWRWYHTHDSRRSPSGFPDLVLIKPPRVLFVELKAERGRVTKAQQWWLDALAACGQDAGVWRPRDLPAIRAVLVPEAS